MTRIQQTVGREVVIPPPKGGGTAAVFPCEDEEQIYARWPEKPKSDDESAAENYVDYTAPAKQPDGNGKDCFVDEIGTNIYAPTGLGDGYTTPIVFDGWSGSDGSTYDPGTWCPKGPPSRPSGPGPWWGI